MARPTGSSRSGSIRRLAAPPRPSAAVAASPAPAAAPDGGRDHTAQFAGGVRPVGHPRRPRLIDRRSGASTLVIVQWSPCTTSLGCSCREVATPGIPIGTAKSRLHYALDGVRVSADGRTRHGPGRVKGGQVA